MSEFKTTAIDPTSGLVYQSLHSSTGKPTDQPRASGTAFCAYFLSFADMEFSAQLYGALKDQCVSSILGFGIVDEYPPSSRGGTGDIDSGPVIFGIGTSATGFTIASARIHRDEEVFTSLYRTAYLFGAPFSRNGKNTYLIGGPLGNAVLLAMCSARTRHPARKL